MSTTRHALGAAVPALLIACLGVPVGIVLDVWHQGRDPAGFYELYVLFGLPFALLAVLLGLTAFAVAARTGHATRRLAVGTGVALGSVAGALLRTPIMAATCFAVGGGAAVAFWHALPLRLRESLAARAP
jgi:hypothetical protein